MALTGNSPSHPLDEILADAKEDPPGTTISRVCHSVSRSRAEVLVAVRRERAMILLEVAPLIERLLPRRPPS
jgi:hypothetical protein